MPNFPTSQGKGKLNKELLLLTYHLGKNLRVITVHVSYKERATFLHCWWKCKLLQSFLEVTG